MKFKGVEGGTPTGAPLCRTCRMAMYVKSESVSSARLFCRFLSTDGDPGELSREMYECTQYVDKRMPDMDSMRSTAWILRTDEFRKSIGFVSPKEWAEKYRRADNVPSHAPWENE